MKTIKEYQNIPKNKNDKINTLKAYTIDEGKTWRWLDNDSYIPPEACDKYGIKYDNDSQCAMRNWQNEQALKALRKESKKK